MDGMEKEGKTVEEAILSALAEMGVSREETEVIVLQESSRGFLGLGAKNALVRVEKKFNPEKLAKQFLQEIFLAMGIVVKMDFACENKRLSITLSGERMGILIGKRGQTLDALQYLTSLVVNRSKLGYVSVVLDTENYRQKRKEILENLARSLAKKVKMTGRKVVLEPMNPYERRIIHSFLQNDALVDTHSEGVDPHRYVVITKKNN